tara:strand:- start:253 stop:495 length:243 start_codon:yes stop_codon:yes gene_type:complete
MYKYKVTEFNATVSDRDKDQGGKIRIQLEEALAEHANDGWEFVGQYSFGYSIAQTGCFGGTTGKSAGDGSVRQLVFRKEV